MSTILIMAGTYFELLICICFSSIFSSSVFSPQASRQLALPLLPQSWYIAETKEKLLARVSGFDSLKAHAWIEFVEIEGGKRGSGWRKRQSELGKTSSVSRKTRLSPRTERNIPVLGAEVGGE